MLSHDHSPLPFGRPRCRWCLRALVANHEWNFWETKAHRRLADAASIEWQHKMGENMAAWRASRGA